jgi:hypothetical protein
MKSKTYRFSTLSKEPGSDIVFIEYAKNLKLNLAIAKEIVADRFDFMKGQKHYLLVDVTNIKYYSPEVKAFMRDREGGAKNVLAGAFIAPNLVATLLANVFVKKINTVPVKIFSSKNEALNWIKELKDKS